MTDIHITMWRRIKLRGNIWLLFHACQNKLSGSALDIFTIDHPHIMELWPFLMGIYTIYQSYIKESKHSKDVCVSNIFWIEMCTINFTE